MRSFAGPGSSVEFTHLSKAAGASLTQTFSARKDADLSDAECHTEGVLDLMKARGIPLDKVCLLDPKAPKELAPDDGEEFEWFLFGVSDFTSSPLASSTDSRVFVRVS